MGLNSQLYGICWVYKGSNNMILEYFGFVWKWRRRSTSYGHSNNRTFMINQWFLGYRIFRQPHICGFSQTNWWYSPWQTWGIRWDGNLLLLLHSVTIGSLWRLWQGILYLPDMCVVNWYVNQCVRVRTNLPTINIVLLFAHDTDWHICSLMADPVDHVFSTFQQYSSTKKINFGAL